MPELFSHNYILQVNVPGSLGLYNSTCLCEINTINRFAERLPDMGLRRDYESDVVSDLPL